MAPFDLMILKHSFGVLEFRIYICNMVAKMAELCSKLHILLPTVCSFIVKV